MRTKPSPSHYRVGPTLFCLGLLIAPAWAQAQQTPDMIELSEFGGVSLFTGVNRNGASEKFLNGGVAGARGAYNFSEHFGLEASYGFSVNNLRITSQANQFFAGVNANFGNRIQSISLNPVYNFTNRDARFRPYVTAGPGGSWFSPTGQARTQFPFLTKSTEFEFDYGGGVKYRLSRRLGLRLDARGIIGRNPNFGFGFLPLVHPTAIQATAGLVFYFRQAPTALTPVAATPEPKPTLQPLNEGELTGATGQLCQGRVLTLHATATDPAGHSLSYKWTVNGKPEGANNPDLAYKPNNAGDFAVEVEVADSSDAARSVRLGPKTLSIQDYVQPKINAVTASPTLVKMGPESPANQTVILAADVVSTPCGGNLTYKWSVTEGTLTNAAGPSAVFETNSLSFDSGLGQTKTITATVVATDETGQSVTKIVNFVVDYPPQYKRLPDVIFARNSARVNNCGKRILIEQAVPQAGSAFDVLLVGHRSSDEVESVPSTSRDSLHSSTLDWQRLMSVAAVLTGNHRVCGNLDLAQVRVSADGTDQISPADPGFCGTSTIPKTTERRGADVAEADKERRVEVYLVPKGSHILPPAAKNAAVVSPKAVKALGCPK